MALEDNNVLVHKYKLSLVTWIPSRNDNFNLSVAQTSTKTKTKISTIWFYKEAKRPS